MLLEAWMGGKVSLKSVKPFHFSTLLRTKCLLGSFSIFKANGGAELRNFDVCKY